MLIPSRPGAKSRQLYGNVDGRHAMSEADIRMLVGTATLAFWSTLYRGNSADDSAVDSMRRVSAGGLRVSTAHSGRECRPTSRMPLSARGLMHGLRGACLVSTHADFADESLEGRNRRNPVDRVAMANFRVDPGIGLCPWSNPSIRECSAS